MNNTVASNPYPPVNFAAVLAGTSPVLSKAEIKRILEITEAETAFQSRRSELSPLALRNAIKQRIRTFATDGGEVPDTSPEDAESISRIALAELRRKFDEDFDQNCRAFLAGIYGKLLERCRATLAAITARHEAEARELGLPYLPPPAVRSVEKAISLLERDHELLAAKGHFPTGQLLCRKLGIEIPKPAAKPELQPVAA